MGAFGVLETLLRSEVFQAERDVICTGSSDSRWRDCGFGSGVGQGLGAAEEELGEGRCLPRPGLGLGRVVTLGQKD